MCDSHMKEVERILETAILCLRRKMLIYYMNFFILRNCEFRVIVICRVVKYFIANMKTVCY